MSTVPKPTAAEIDQLARQIIEVDGGLKAANELAGELRARAVELVKAHGTTPANATKSKRLEGETHQLTATFGQSSSLMPGAVERCAASLKAMKLTRIFKQLFAREDKYVAVRGGAEVLEKLDTRTRKKVEGLYQSCFSVSDNKPSLKAEARAQSEKASA